MGTACYLKGAPEILEEIKKVLHVKEGEPTADGIFHLDIVRCLGCCGLAPVMTIDQKVYGKIKKTDIPEIISSFLKERKQPLSLQSKENAELQNHVHPILPLKDYGASPQ